MYEYRIDDIAALELQEADHIYVSYFAKLGEYEKGEAWAARFFDDYFEHIDALKRNPFLYSECSLYPFGGTDVGYRSFRVGRFIVFYTVEETSFTVWHVRSSRSDFSTLRPFA